MQRREKNNADNLINKILEEYNILKTKISKRLDDFKKVRENEYFYELAYCLLTPQSSARNADAVVKKLIMKDFFNKNFNPEKILAQKSNYIRFHKNKSRWLIELRQNYSRIHKFLLNGKDNYELREWLVKNVKGLGYKEASHFLRNIGKSDLAILDRHILRNLHRLKVIKKVPESLSKKKYLEIENKFKKFSGKVGIPMDELDLLFWYMETGEILK